MVGPLAEDENRTKETWNKVLEGESIPNNLKDEMKLKFPDEDVSISNLLEQEEVSISKFESVSASKGRWKKRARINNNLSLVDGGPQELLMNSDQIDTVVGGKRSILEDVEMDEKGDCNPKRIKQRSSMYSTNLATMAATAQQSRRAQ